MLDATTMLQALLDQAISRANMLIEHLVTYRNCDARCTKHCSA